MVCVPNESNVEQVASFKYTLVVLCTEDGKLDREIVESKTSGDSVPSQLRSLPD